MMIDDDDLPDGVDGGCGADDEDTNADDEDTDADDDGERWICLRW